MTDKTFRYRNQNMKYSGVTSNEQTANSNTKYCRLYLRANRLC